MSRFSAFVRTASLQVIGGVLAFAFFAGVGQALAPAEYARFALFQVAAQGVGVLAWEWAAAAFARFAREEYLLRGTFRGTTSIRLAAFAASLPIVLALGWALRSRGRFGLVLAEPLPVLAALLAYTFSSILLSHAQYTLQVRGAFARSGGILVAARGVSLALLVLLVARGGLGAAATLLLLAAGQAFGGLLAGNSLRASLAPPRADAPPPPAAKAFLSFAAPSLLAVVFNFLSSWIAVYLAARYLVPARAGAYAYAHQGLLFLHLNVAMAAAGPILNNLFIDEEVRGGASDAAFRRYAQEDAHRLAFLWSIFVAAAGSALGTLFLLVRGGAYAEGADLLPFLLPGVASLVVGTLWTPLFQVRLWAVRTQVVTGLMLASTLAATAILAPRWGIHGVAAGTAVGFVLSSVFVLVFAARAVAPLGGLLLDLAALAPAVLAGGAWGAARGRPEGPWLLGLGVPLLAVYLARRPLRAEEKAKWSDRLAALRG